MRTWKIPLAFSAFVASMIAGCYALDELRYAVWGRSAEGTVTESFIALEPGSEIDSQKVRVVRFSFRDQDGRPQSGVDRVHPDSPIQAGDRIAVQYIGGDEYRKRLEGNRQLGALIFFFCCFGAVVAFVCLLARGADAPVHGHRHA
jgi:hypothetical protein